MIFRDLALRMRARKHGAIAAPPGRWELSITGTRRAPVRIWTGYGHEFRVRPQGLGEPWLVIDGSGSELYEGSHPFRFVTKHCRDVMHQETGGRMGVGRAD